MARPGDEIPADAGGDGHLRASRADREQAIDVLKVAFVQGRLTKGELDVRVGRALAARTYAELASVTADIPAGPGLAQPAEPVLRQPRRSRNRAARRAVKSGICAIAAITVAVSTVAVAAGQPGAAVILAVFMVILAAVATTLVASVIAAVLALESRHRKRSDGQLPPRAGSGPGGQASQRPVPADPAGQLPPVDHGQEHWSLARKRQVPYRNAGAQPLPWAIADTIG